MNISIYGLSDGSFRLSDSKHSGEMTESEPFFDLSEGEMTFTIEQISAGERRKPLARFLSSVVHFTRVIWDGFFGHPSIYSESHPIMIEAKAEVKHTRFSEHTIAFTPSGYAPDTHDYTPPLLDGGKDIAIRPTAYMLDEAEIERRKKETLIEKVGASTVLLLIPILLLVAGVAIKAGTLSMIGIFLAVVFYPLILVMLLRWRTQCKQFEVKAANKTNELNQALGAPQY